MTNWQSGLPPEYLVQAVPPERFERFADQPAHAAKTRGYAADGQLCYYRHAYSRTSPVLDEEDCFGEDESYYEEVIAWRLAGGLWLTRCYRAGEAGRCGARLVAPEYRVAEACPV